MTDKYLDEALESITSLHKGSGFDIQEQLAKLSELHLRTPAGKSLLS